MRATVEAPCDGRDRGKETLVSLNLLALSLAAGESLPHGGADGQEYCQGRQVNLETQDIFSCLKILCEGLTMLLSMRSLNSNSLNKSSFSPLKGEQSSLAITQTLPTWFACWS